MFNKLIQVALLLVSLSAGAQSGLNIARPDVVETQDSHRNYVINPSALTNLSGTATSSATLARDTDTADRLEGVASFLCDASAQGGYCQFSTRTIPNEDRIGNCEAKAMVKGDLSLYQLQVHDGTNQVAISDPLRNFTDWTPVSVNVPCGSPRSVRLVQTTAGVSPAVNIGRIYYGRATNLSQASQAAFVGGMEQAGATTCTYAQNTSSGNANFVTLGASSCSTPWVNQGAITNLGPTRHEAVFNNMPPGQYLIILSGIFQQLPGGGSRWRITDGTNSSNINGIGGSAGDLGHSQLVFHMTYTTAGNRTFALQVADNFVGSANWVNDATLTASWKFYRFPLASEQAVRADTSSFVWAGYHDATCNGWLRTSTAWGDFTADATCNLVQTVNSGAGTVTSPTGVLPGLVFTPSTTGVYEICAGYSINAGSVVGMNTRLWDQTASAELASLVTTNAVGNYPEAHYICGMVNVTSIGGTRDIRIQGNSSSNTTGIGFVQTGTLPSVITWTLKRLTQNFPAPLLVGSVTSSSAGAERIERVQLASICTTGTCTLEAVPGNATSWVTSITHGGVGIYTINFAPGVFAGPPMCTVTGIADTMSQAGGGPAPGGVPSTTSWSYRTFDRVGTFTNSRHAVVCIGPRVLP